jgi:hypothetical protein
VDFALLGDEMRAREFFDNDNFFAAFFLSRDFLHINGKLVTSARNCDDKFFVFLKAAESFSQGENILRQSRLLDKSVRPNIIEKTFFLNHFSVIAEQQNQSLKSLRSQRNRLILKLQTSFPDVQIEIVEFEKE